MANKLILHFSLRVTGRQAHETRNGGPIKETCIHHMVLLSTTNFGQHVRDCGVGVVHFGGGVEVIHNGHEGGGVWGDGTISQGGANAEVLNVVARWWEREWGGAVECWEGGEALAQAKTICMWRGEQPHSEVPRFADERRAQDVLEDVDEKDKELGDGFHLCHPGPALVWCNNCIMALQEGMR